MSTEPHRTENSLALPSNTRGDAQMMQLSPELLHCFRTTLKDHQHTTRKPNPKTANQQGRLLCPLSSTAVLLLLTVVGHHRVAIDDDDDGDASCKLSMSKLRTFKQ